VLPDPPGRYSAITITRIRLWCVEHYSLTDYTSE